MAFQRGREAEADVERWLRQKGWQILEKNYRTPLGEVDLIAADGKTTVFVEVRCRGRNALQRAASTVSPAKQRRLVRTALSYLKRTGTLHTPEIRFDVVAVDGGRLELISNAFGAEGYSW